MQASEKVVSPAIDSSLAQPLMRWTIEDYHRLAESGILANRRVELIDGNLVEMAPEGAPHSHTLSSGADYLRHHLSGQALIREAHPITLSVSEPEPDIAVVKLPRSQYQNRHPMPEDILFLIEVSNSTLAYDLTTKKETYSEAGILEYWVVDVTRQIHVFRNLESGVYTEEIVFKSGSIQPLSFPSVAIRVDAFWGVEV
ncbi:MAG: Uma2 family endonuclease [Phormidesmis sp.]